MRRCLKKYYIISYRISKFPIENSIIFLKKAIFYKKWLTVVKMYAIITSLLHKDEGYGNAVG